MGERGEGAPDTAATRDRARQPPRRVWRRGYGIVVGALKVGLPLVAVGLVLLVIVWPRLFPARNGVEPVNGSSVTGAGEDLAMTDPRYVGRDDRNRPFTVRAQRAKESGAEGERIYLAQPHGTITLDNGRSLAAGAKSGWYSRDRRMLTLDGNVTVRHSSGYMLHTSAAEVDFKAGTAVSDRPVVGYGPAGTVYAQGVQVLDDGDTVIFTGRSQVTLDATDNEDPS